MLRTLLRRLIHRGTTTCFLFALAFPAAAVAQPDRRFDHLTMDDGLSESIVLNILQDRRGFMWFGTADGLNRYDGNNVKVYHSTPSDSSTLSHNYIQCIFEDRSGDLWIGSLGGLDLFDPVHESFHRIPLGRQGTGRKVIPFAVQSVAQSSADGSLWLGTGEGLFHVSVKRSTSDGSISAQIMRHYKADEADPRGFHGSIVNRIAFDREGSLWVGTRDDGLNLLRSGSEMFEHFLHREGDDESLSDNFVQIIYEDHHGSIWVGTEAGGVNRYDRSSGRFHRYENDRGRSGSLGNNIIRTIFEDRSGQLWVGTDGGGLDRYDPAADAFTHLRHDAVRPSSLASDRVTAVYEDRAGALWVGTWGNGVDRWSPSKDKFRNPSKFWPLREDLTNPFVISLFVDSRGILWAGTHGGGAFGLHPGTGEVDHLPPDPGKPGALADGAVWSIREDRDGDLWIATNQGVDRYNARTRRITHFDQAGPSGNRLSSRFAGRAEPDGDYVWVTTEKGLDRIDRASGRVMNFPYALALGEHPQGYVSGLYREKNIILLGTSTIIGFDTQTLTFVPRSFGLDEIQVSCIVGDREGNLWVGTFGDGVFLLDSRRSLVAHFTQENGLPNNVVYGILEDAGGNYWMSTNKGIAMYSLGTKTFRNYDVTDGLQSNEFNRGAFWQGRDGMMYFGGVNGFNAFHPDSIRGNPYRPPVVFTAFKWFNDPIPLPVSSSTVREIPLTFRENYFSFEFAALDFTEPQKNRYAYRLDGFDEGWINCGTRTFAAYTNLDPGIYTLRVKGSNNDGLWNEEGASVLITITPPWWRTTWAYLLYVLTAAGAGAGIRWLVQNWNIILASRKARYVAHYRVHELLGEGGMGKVFRASDLRTKRIVALKVLSPELLKDPENRRRLVSEGQILSSFQHPHIVKVFEVGESEQRGYIAMEYLSGGTLKERLARGFPFPPAA